MLHGLLVDEIHNLRLVHLGPMLEGLRLRYPRKVIHGISYTYLRRSLNYFFGSSCTLKSFKSLKLIILSCINLPLHRYMTRLNLNGRILENLELAGPRRIILMTKLPNTKLMRQLAIYPTTDVGILQLLLFKGRRQKRERRVELDTAYSIVERLDAELHRRSVVR